MASGDVIKTIGEVDIGAALESEIGKISSFGHEAADPLKYLVCEGGDVSRATYAKLFAKIGESFGVGDGSTTFGLPNLIDQFLRGKSGTRVIGNEQGSMTGTPANPFVAGSDGDHTHSVPYSDSTLGTDGSASYVNMYSGSHGYYTSGSGTHTHPISGGDAETRPKNIAVKFYIRYEG